MHCIKSGKTCITTQKHELITLSEILYRFYKKESSINSALITKIRKMGKIISQYRTEDLDNFENKYNNIKDQVLPIKKAYSDLLDKFISNFKEKNAKEIHNLKILSKTDDLIEKDISNIFLNIRLPIIDVKSIGDAKKLKKIIDDGNKLSTPNNFVNSLKLLNNRNKSCVLINKLNDKILANKVCSNISNMDNNKEKLEKKIDTILKELETKFDESLEALKSSLLVQNKTTKISLTYTQFVSFASNPKNLNFKKNICSIAHKTNTIDKVFCVFNSFLKINLLCWGNTNHLEFYDIDSNKIIKDISNAHTSTIFCCRHFPDNRNKIDYILTTSLDYSIKLWNVNNFLCQTWIKNAYMTKNIFSACMLLNEYSSHSYIVTSCVNDFMKLYDLTGKYKFSFGFKDANTFFVNSYFDIKNKKYYVINGNGMDVRSYNAKNGQLYNRYQGLPRSFHTGAVIYETKTEIILVEIDGNGYIRMWNFHTAELLKAIFTSSFLNLRGICLWNYKYLIVGANDHQIKIVDLKQGKISKSFKEHTATICTLEKINTKLYGQCLLSQGMDGSIKLWSTK
jgi:WD40 repeat protein